MEKLNHYICNHCKFEGLEDLFKVKILSIMYRPKPNNIQLERAGDIRPAPNSIA